MAGTTRRILVIDDEESIRLLIADALTIFGYEVDVAADGASGLDLFRRRHFDLVITDFRMPGMSGVDVVHRLRKEAPATPVMLHTGFAGDTQVTALCRAGVPVLAKPTQLHALEAAVLRALGASPAA